MIAFIITLIMMLKNQNLVCLGHSLLFCEIRSGQIPKSTYSSNIPSVISLLLAWSENCLFFLLFDSWVTGSKMHCFWTWGYWGSGSCPIPGIWAYFNFLILLSFSITDWFFQFLSFSLSLFYFPLPGQGSANSLWKGLNSKYFRFCRLPNLGQNYHLAQKQP